MLLKCVMLLPLLVVGTAIEGGETNQRSTKGFRVACQLMSPDSDEAIRAPVITVFAGQQANIRDETQTPFVTDLVEKNGVAQPVVEVVSEGFAIDVRVRETADGKILLQLNAEHNQIRDVEEIQLATGLFETIGHAPTIQCPRIDQQSIRGSRTLNDGETVEFGLVGGQRIKVNVRRTK